MAVTRIVANCASADPAATARFYRDLLGLETDMDQGWIITLTSGGTMRPQISFAREGGSGAPVPDLSIEVDDLDAVHRQAVAAGLAIEYGPVVEPWGVRRFFLRDPGGRLLNILAHV